MYEGRQDLWSQIVSLKVMQEGRRKNGKHPLQVLGCSCWLLWPKAKMEDLVSARDRTGDLARVKRT